MTIAVTLDGLHPTTACCIQALQDLQHEHTFSHILDLGCGDGILSLFSAALWPQAQVIGADISAKAVSDAETASHQHGACDRTFFVRSDSFSNAHIAQHAPYDLIICNLLAEPIHAMAPQMYAHSRTDGVVILSGILAWLTDQVCEAYQAEGFTLRKRYANSTWHSLILVRS